MGFSLEMIVILDDMNCMFFVKVFFKVEFDNNLKIIWIVWYMESSLIRIIEINLKYYLVLIE